MRQPKTDKERATQAFILFIFMLYGPILLWTFITSPFVALWRWVSSPFGRAPR